MSITIALAGNPNSGKTTLFNHLTGSNQYVGNWPGVTVEKKEGKLKGNSDVTVTDLPGIYSLSPYTLEEVVARNYLAHERPDVILNIVDGTNIERNLYLTTQLLELGIPIVVAVNMMDILRRNGDKLDTDILSRELGCPVVCISAISGEGASDAADVAVEAAKNNKKIPAHLFSGEVEHAIAHIEEAAVHGLPDEQQRWYAIKIFERDKKVLDELHLSESTISHIEKDIVAAELMLDDDAEGIITNERYEYITKVTKKCYVRKNAGKLSISDKIDKVVTNKFLALPIFATVMWLVYTISIGTIGDWTVGFMNDTLFGNIIVPATTSILQMLGCADWLINLIADAIIGGVGAVLGFVPQMLILFFMLCILEDVGYMARIAFIMDKIFRKFGLSGKSFIPMLVASGCGVPGIMASRTIEQDRDRKITIMTTGFIPCGAKMPIVGLIASSLFGNSPLIATSAYFIGVASVIISGVILKKTKLFAGNPSPFVMEIPAYHAPKLSNVLKGTWERGWSFIKRAGSVILAASIIIWLLNSISFDGGFHIITDGNGKSILNVIGEWISYIFVPLGFGRWEAAVATLLGLVAKEEVVGVFGSLSSMLESVNPQAAADLLGAMESDVEGINLIGIQFFGGSRLSGFSFLIFNLLCAPCFAAMGAIKREMNNSKWTAFAITYMCVFAYAISFIIYQLGLVVSGSTITISTIFAVVVLAILLYLIFRKNPHTEMLHKGRNIEV